MIEMYTQMSRMNDKDLDNKITTMSENNETLRQRIVNATTEINDQESEFHEL